MRLVNSVASIRARAARAAASDCSSRDFVTQPSLNNFSMRPYSASARSRSARAALRSAATVLLSSAARMAPRFTRSPSSYRTDATLPPVVKPSDVSRRRRTVPAAVRVSLLLAGWTIVTWAGIGSVELGFARGSLTPHPVNKTRPPKIDTIVLPSVISRISTPIRSS